MILIVAILYPKSSEQHGHSEEDHNDHEAHKEKTLLQKFDLVRRILGFKKVQKILLYVTIACSTSCNFEVFLTYVNEYYGIKAVFEGSMITIAFFGTTLWLVAYSSGLANTRTRYFIIAAILGRVVTSLLTSYNFDYGVKDTKAKWIFAINCIFF